MDNAKISELTLIFLKRAVLLQHDLYKDFRNLTAEKNVDQAAYLARAANKVGLAVSELEDLFNSLGHQLPWQKFFHNENEKGGA